MSYNNVLHEMTATTPTVLWNDSCATKELSTSIDRNGAVGATCNPVIVLEVLKKEWEAWKPRIEELVAEMPNASEDDIAWRLTEEMSIKAAALLKPVFDREKGVNGRLSIQTNPKYWRDPKRLVEQAVHFSKLAPNIIVKIPATEAGIVAIEEATALGISINATVSFTVPKVETKAPMKASCRKCAPKAESDKPVGKVAGTAKKAALVEKPVVTKTVKKPAATKVTKPVAKAPAAATSVAKKPAVKKTTTKK